MKRLLATLALMGLAMNSPAAAADRVRVNLNPILNHRHTALFQSADPELQVFGGAGAGKSYSIADKLFVQGILNPTERQKIVVVRKTLASIRKTTLDIIERRAEALHRPFVLDRSSWTARCGNQTWVFTGMNNREDYQKIKSLTDVNFIWANELTEFREEDYKELGLRLRGARGTGKYAFRQIISDFNPIGKTSWVHDRFWVRLPHAARKLRYTVLDNPWAEPEYIERLRQTAKDDLNFHRIYFLGEWGEIEGVIFNWDVVPLPDIAFDEIFYGGDFGYSIDPAGLVRIYRKADEFWLEELIYKTELTNPMLAIEAVNAGMPADASSYWDSAEPKSIKELCDNGLNALPAEKGPDSVRAGIDYLKARKIHIVSGPGEKHSSPNLIKEQRSYVWKKNKDGKPLPEPIKFNDHLMSAARYGIFTHCNAVLPNIRSLRS